VKSTPAEALSNTDTDRKRRNVVTQDAVIARPGHPRPSGRAVDAEVAGHVNPSRSRTTIRQHLGRLVEAGIVENVGLPEDRRQNDLSYVFYGISEEGRRFLGSRETGPMFERRTPYSSSSAA
jgi:hypothetical protein